MVDPIVDPHVPNEFFTNPLSLSEALHMIRPISDEEIRWAVFHIGNDKAPGPDGYTSKFFKSAWNIVGKDLQIAVHNFFYSGRLLKEINHTLLCFIPKVPNASRVNDFWPISCYNVLYKVISKVIAERMKPYLFQLIGPEQSAFIPGRRISDNILMAHELVAGYQRNSGRPRCAFKIDLRKAYDTVDWRFLLGMLRGLGFHPVFCNWIDQMLQTSSFLIVLNGETSGFFEGARGLRQGDPISPYLFTIVMECFSMILKRCIMEAESFLFHQGCDELAITHLCFADDLFVFTGGDLASVEVLKRALDMFRRISGLEPNISKSDAFFCNVTPEDRAVILNCLPFKPAPSQTTRSVVVASATATNHQAAPPDWWWRHRLSRTNTTSAPPAWWLRVDDVIDHRTAPQHVVAAHGCRTKTHATIWVAVIGGFRQRTTAQQRRVPPIVVAIMIGWWRRRP
ncbi:hypothetical protein OSB04_023383 [Centaurea solstitialis]|uniref:Reverse transcriptase domain-containing protein n=1 Tax=Centaurea solstitialis TaxID=347529 RepID=A0AA38SXE8_9ASTR|nr:hypothetical protein OSB04_023383 [Centaurea solstitialis]